jgi:hypothetical protein
MSIRDLMSWRSALEPAERENLASELACALLGYWHQDPTDDVLNRVASVLAEWQDVAAIADRIRPGDVVTLSDFEGGAR